MRRIREHLTYANVMATIAVFVALGGGAYALDGRNSVDSGDIQRNAVKSSDIARGAVKGSEIANGRVGAADLGRIIEVSNTIQIPANSNEGTLGQCPAGTQVISGGGFPGFNSGTLVVFKAQDNNWRVDARNSANMPMALTAYAYCLKR
jgi:hypothetical protein